MNTKREMERHARLALYHLYTLRQMALGCNPTLARKKAKWNLGRKGYVEHLNDWMREGEGVTTME